MKTRKRRLWLSHWALLLLTMKSPSHQSGWSNRARLSWHRVRHVAAVHRQLWRVAGAFFVATMPLFTRPRSSTLNRAPFASFTTMWRLSRSVCWWNGSTLDWLVSWAVGWRFWRGKVWTVIIRMRCGWFASENELAWYDKKDDQIECTLNTGYVVQLCGYVSILALILLWTCA